MKTVIFTSDKHLWLLRGFFKQWERYGGAGMNSFGNIEVAGFSAPTEGDLPSGVSFHSIGKFEDYPIQKWSDGVISYLNSIQDEHVLFLLEDYWMMRKINMCAISSAVEYMKFHKNTIRFDVAADRMFNKHAKYIGHFGEVDLCEAKEDYSLSFQASIYRREALLEFMKPGETPWEAEIYGSHRLNRSEFRVVGSYQWPMNYMIVVNKGKLDRLGSWMYPARSLTQYEWRELDSLGYTTPGGSNNEHQL